MVKISIRERLDKWTNRVSSAYTLWPLIPVGAMSGLVAYLSAGVNWINQMGAFGWALVGVLTFAILSASLLGFSVAKEKWTHAKIARDKAAPSDSVNPLESEFTKRRIRLSDMVRPSTQRIVDKTFTDCQLLGPMMISPVFGTEFNGTTFVNCNWVVVKPGLIYNVIGLERVKVRGGDLSDVTILVPEDGLEMIRALGVPLINRIGDEEIDERRALTGRSKFGDSVS
jgi:hypothetical protein